MDPVVSDLSSTEDDSSGSDSFGSKSCESVALDIQDGVSFVLKGWETRLDPCCVSEKEEEKEVE